VIDDPDTPYDPSILVLAGKRMRDGGGTLARLIKADAGKRRQRARQMRDRGDDPGAERQEHDAAYMERHADRFSEPLEVIGSPLTAGIGGEVASADPAKPTACQAEVGQSPDMLAAEATEQRLTLTSKVSGTALTLGLEMAESIGACDALERNLAHQVAVTHALGMTLAATANSFAVGVKPWAPEARQQVQSIEAARMAREAARMFEASQRGMLTLERLRHGGQQVVTVQHVTVREGGQAVVAGTVTRGDRRK
jgi:hypothetical protein